jgi:hypothetical protein
VTTTISETLPAVECTPWCEDGTGHTDAWHPDDQWCYGPSRTVTLSRMPLQTFEEHKWLDNIRVYLARERDGRPYLHLGRDDLAGVKMDLNEVRELRDTLTDILRTASLSV